MVTLIPAIVAEVLERDLQTLEKEIKAFKEEKHLWQITGDIKNSAGNLTLHLCGNLQHFIGAILGHSGYIRNRDAEFATKDVSRDKLLAEIEQTRKAVKHALETFDDKELDKDYPFALGGKTSSKAFFLVHLVSHFNYHLGQINYLRRVLEPTA